MATFILPVVAPDFDLAEWALVARAWNAFRTPGVPQHDRIAAALGRAVASGCGADRTPDVQQPPPPSDPDSIPLPWRVGGRNPDPRYPDEVAIMADVAKGQLLGPKKIPAVKNGSLCVAVAMPVGVRPDTYPEMTDAVARRIVSAVNATAPQPGPSPSPSRWARLADRVSPSGRVVYRCGRCGRDSVSCDRSCPAGCHSDA